jgi:hypothetical protein
LDAEQDDADDEPSLGFLERHCSAYGFSSGRDQSGDQSRTCDGLGDNLEDEHDGAEPPEDDEPSLGCFDRPFDQRVAWNVSRSSQLDSEQDDCDGEDSEPLLTECT